MPLFAISGSFGRLSGFLLLWQRRAVIGERDLSACGELPRSS